MSSGSEDASFLNSREHLGHFVGPSENCGDLLTFKIFVPQTQQIIHRSVLRSAVDDNDHPNLRALNPNYSDKRKNDDDDGSDLSSIDVNDAADKSRID